MNLPIDEMLADLRQALESFEEVPSYDTLDDVINECARITVTCEDELDA